MFLIGCAAMSGSLSPDILHKMAIEHTQRSFYIVSIFKICIFMHVREHERAWFLVITHNRTRLETLDTYKLGRNRARNRNQPLKNKIKTHKHVHLDTPGLYNLNNRVTFKFMYIEIRAQSYI